MRNVTDWILDFVNFLVEKYRNEGLSSRRLIKHESVRLTLLSYRSTFNLSMKGRQKTQTWLDFCKMPTVDQFRKDKAKICKFIEDLLKKGQKNRGLIVVQCQQLMKALIALVVFTTACCVSSAIYILHEHYNQLSRNSVEEDFCMPLAPAKLWPNEALVLLNCVLRENDNVCKKFNKNQQQVLRGDTVRNPELQRQNNVHQGHRLKWLKNWRPQTMKTKKKRLSLNHIWKNQILHTVHQDVFARQKKQRDLQFPKREENVL